MTHRDEDKSSAPAYTWLDLGWPRADAMMPDVTIVLGDESATKIHAHSAVLSVRSRRFRSIFKVKTDIEHRMGDDASPASQKAMLRYLYRCDEAKAFGTPVELEDCAADFDQIEDAETLAGILKLANNYGVPKLRTSTLRRIIKLLENRSTSDTQSMPRGEFLVVLGKQHEATLRPFHNALREVIGFNLAKFVQLWEWPFFVGHQKTMAMWILVDMAEEYATMALERAASRHDSGVDHCDSWSIVDGDEKHADLEKRS